MLRELKFWWEMFVGSFKAENRRQNDLAGATYTAIFYGFWVVVGLTVLAFIFL